MFERVPGENSRWNPHSWFARMRKAAEMLRTESLDQGLSMNMCEALALDRVHVLKQSSSELLASAGRPGCTFTSLQQ